MQFPGNHGGVNWGGASFNPQLGYLFVNTSELGQLQGFAEREPNPAGTEAPAGRGGRGSNSPYRDVPGGGRFKDADSNMMCQQPPWGQLTAVNVHTGEFAWRSVLGVTDSLPPDKQKTGRPGNGGSIATAGGLVFIGATDDNRFRAFDARTGTGTVDGEARRNRARDTRARISARTAGNTSSSRRPAAASSKRR